VWNVSDVIVTDGDRGNAIGLLKWLAAKGIYPSPLEAGDLVEWIASRRVQVAAEERARMLPDVRAAMVEAREALESLVDEQNGPPMLRRENQWRDAMAKCRTALARLDAILSQGTQK
jgi:hypothetical protein